MTHTRMQQFVAATAVAGVVIALGATAVLLVPIFRPMSIFWPLPMIWCFVPLAWGLWSLLAPATVVPARLPWWGAALGAVAGIGAGFVFDVLGRRIGQPLPLGVRWLLVPFGFAVYYVLWMAVRAVYCRLVPPGTATPEMVRGKAAA